MSGVAGLANLHLDGLVLLEPSGEWQVPEGDRVLPHPRRMFRVEAHSGDAHGLTSSPTQTWIGLHRDEHPHRLLDRHIASFLAPRHAADPRRRESALDRIGLLATRPPLWCPWRCTGGFGRRTRTLLTARVRCWSARSVAAGSFRRRAPARARTSRAVRSLAARSPEGARVSSQAAIASCQLAPSLALRISASMNSPGMFKSLEIVW